MQQSVFLNLQDSSKIAILQFLVAEKQNTRHIVFIGSPRAGTSDTCQSFYVANC